MSGHVRRVAPAAFRLSVAALLLLLLACSSRVDNPSAFDSERFLCDSSEAELWRDELDQCRDAYQTDRSCGGLASFKGQLQGQAVTVDSLIDIASFDDELDAEGVRLRSEVKLSGASPYFGFRFRFTDIGGDVLGAESRALNVIRGSAPAEPGPLRDLFAHASLRLSASSTSFESAATGGTLTMTEQTEDEQAGTFHLELAPDLIDGCFHAFATERQLSSPGLE